MCLGHRCVRVETRRTIAQEDKARTFQSSSTLHVPAVSSSRHIFILLVISPRQHSEHDSAQTTERYLWSRLQVARRRP